MLLLQDVSQLFHKIDGKLSRTKVSIVHRSNMKVRYPTSEAIVVMYSRSERSLQIRISFGGTRAVKTDSVRTHKTRSGSSVNPAST